MTQQRLTKQDIDEFLKENNTPEKARKILRDAGIIDENGNLTKPYQPEQLRLDEGKVQRSGFRDGSTTPKPKIIPKGQSTKNKEQ
jgi:hypothetical protein